MAKHSRDEFPEQTKNLLARRVGYICSNPDCLQYTLGPEVGGPGFVNQGVAAHIVAAAQGKGAKRRDPNLKPEDRKDQKNGIWLCQTCAKLIDSDEHKYTVPLLHQWKNKAEQQAVARLGRRYSDGTQAVLASLHAFSLTLQQITELGYADSADIDTVRVALGAAATADAAAFRRDAKLPPYVAEPHLTALDSPSAEPLSLASVAAALEIADGSVILATPGTGKSTVLLLAAEAINAAARRVAVIVPLPEWATRNRTIFEYLVTRDKFSSFPARAFMLLARSGRLVLLLDGWNEISAAERDRLKTELVGLHRDYELLAITLASRPGTDLPPFENALTVAPLSYSQQRAIARGISGVSGESLLESAWSTPGLEELVGIPLYLTAMLRGGSTLPRTKEAVLRNFMARQLTLPRNSRLNEQLHGMQDAMLQAIGEAMQRAGTVMLPADLAGPLAVSAQDVFKVSRRITEYVQPMTALSILTENYILVRTADGTGVQFQHQQFQEWHASFAVERLIESIREGNAEAIGQLTDGILNIPSWDEATLFAVERVNDIRPTAESVELMAIIITKCLTVAPMLAAEIIRRCDDAVWARVGTAVTAFVDRWHVPGDVDRAARFMMLSGQPEFAGRLWALLASADREVRLWGLRNAPKLYWRSLGPDAATRITSCPGHIRADILHALIGDGDPAARKAAIELGAADHDLEVVLEVVRTCDFYGLSSAVARLMRQAPDGIWAALSKQHHFIRCDDSEVNERLARSFRDAIDGTSDLVQKLNIVLSLPGDSRTTEEIIDILSHKDYPITSDQVRHLFSRDLARGNEILVTTCTRRLVAGLSVPYDARLLLPIAPAVENQQFVETITRAPSHDRNAEAAAAILGPEGTKEVLARYLTLCATLRSQPGYGDDTGREQRRAAEDYLILTRMSSFMPAILSQALGANRELRGDYITLIERYADPEGRRLTLDVPEEFQVPLAAVISQWVTEVLAEDTVKRHTLSQLVVIIRRLGDPSLGPQAHALLVRDLKIRQFLESQGHGDIAARSEYQWDNRDQYVSALRELGDAYCTGILIELLPHPYFGIHAARALSELDGNNPPDAGVRFYDMPRLDLAQKHACRRASGPPRPTTPFSEAIVATYLPLAAAPEPEKRHHALKLACVLFGMTDTPPPRLNDLLANEPCLETRNKALAAQASAGLVIASAEIDRGISDFIKRANDRMYAYTLDPKNHGLQTWLELYPFSDAPEKFSPAVQPLSRYLPERHSFERLVLALEFRGGKRSMSDLLALAELRPDLWEDLRWQSAILTDDVQSGLNALLDRFEQDVSTTNRHGRLERQLNYVVERLLSVRSDLLSVVLERYKRSTSPEVSGIYGDVLAEHGGETVVLAMLDYRGREPVGFKHQLSAAVRKTVLEHRGIGISNAYEQHGRDATSLRYLLFINASEGGNALASRCLEQIDRLRDEYGSVATEPRHPSVESGKPWPLEAPPPA